MRPELDDAPMLTPRGAEEVICHRADGGSVTVGRFLAEAAALAPRLPEGGLPISLCADRYLTLLGFAAALMRGQTMLLSPGRAPAQLRAAAARHRGAYAMADGSVAEAPLPVLRLDLARAAPAPGPVAVPRIPASHVAAIAFTSGSTGEPAAHAKPWGALVAGAAAAAERFGLRPGDGPAPAHVVATVPAQHMYGFETTIMLPLQASVACHAGEGFFPADVRAALAALPPRRLLVTTPLHLRALLAEGRRPAALAAVISATAPLAREMAAAVERDWQAPVLEIYGATEAGSMASRRTTAEASWLPYRGVRMGDGVVEVPGIGAVPLGDALEPGPEPGRFTLLGRRADVVKLGGRRASLAELNRALAGIEGVEDGAFLAPEDLEGNPAARLAAIVVAPGRRAEEIFAGLRGQLDPVFLPRPLVLVPSLPRDRLGKLSRRALLELARSGEAGAA